MTRWERGPRAADHAAYRGGAAKLAYGLGADGRVVHIGEVARGDACGCVCPACKAPLTARKGQLVAAHFAHKAESSCSTAPETALHLLAKEVLQQRKRLHLPAVEVVEDGIRVERHPAREQRFDDAVLEQRLPGVTPDIIVCTRGRDLLVEIYVTHACDDEKIARIRELNISALEIDLSHLPRDASRLEIEVAVLRRAPRRWLFNPFLDEARRRHGEAVAERARQKALKAERQAEASARDWVRLAKVPFARPASEHIAAMREVAAMGYREFIGIDAVGAHAFKIEPLFWQSLLFRQFVVAPSLLMVRGMAVTVPSATSFLRHRGALAPLFGGKRPFETFKRARELEPTFRTPETLIQAYFRFLVQEGLLEEGYREWTVAESARPELSMRCQRELEAADRRRDLRWRVRSLIQRVPEATNFDVEAWCTDPAPALGAPPDTLASVGGDAWWRLREFLKAIERGLDGHGPIPELLGLPGEAAVRRAVSDREAVEARRQVEAHEAAIKAGELRVARVEAAARSVLGIEAHEWLEHALVSLAGATRRDAARDSDQVLERFLRELDLEKSRRDEAREREHRASVARAKLTQAAIDAHGEDWARAFLNSGRSSLHGQRPIDACVDDLSLRRCLDLIPPRSLRRR